MKKFSFYLFLYLIVLFIHQNISIAQWWEDPYGNIHNTNSGDVLITTTLKWSNASSFLSNDQGGSIELGYPSSLCSPYIDFHNGYHDAEDFNIRIINSADYQLEFVTNNWNSAKMTFNGTPSGYYNIPSLKLTNWGSQGNSLQFQSAYGLAAIDFWKFYDNNGVIDFYADYQNNPTYCQFSIKTDNTCGWGNDWSWLSADQGGSIHLNKAGTHQFYTPYIDFSHGRGLNGNVDIRIISTEENTLDFLTNLDWPGTGGTKIMSVKEDGVYTIKLTVQSSWSDFVFNDNYFLLSLTELENYIKENGHLPDIPSESYVKENGIDLGEMTSKLLQKIEELTLYVIDLNKQVELMKKENEDMKTLLKNK